jgi:tripartite-type tricarboxylate transporter receptor subunit TctC
VGNELPTLQKRAARLAEVFRRSRRFASSSRTALQNRHDNFACAAQHRYYRLLEDTMNTVKRFFAARLNGAALALIAAMFAVAPAHAQPAASAFPDKPMRIVVTFTPGGAPDILARLLAERFTAAWGQPVLVDNRPGAGGNTGADFVAKAAPDGLTIVVGTVGTHSINGALYAKMPYDMVKDFSPISLLATTPNMLVVNNDVPAKNLKDFIALGKKEGKMTFASSGSGTSIHVSGELFKTMTGIDMVHIPYKGRATAIPDVLGGRVTMMFDNMPSSLQLVREGKLRALGVTSSQRSAAAPDIPTIAESGLPGFDAVSWFALFAPANTPKPIIEKLQTEVRKILKTPEVAKRLADAGLEPVGSTPDELAAYQKAEIAKWVKVVKESGAKAD